ncbi:major facilitator superfamily domain-containing protein [Xylaria palmicola]|nr:major facilitator superfamily domain-containing protein [Xylaria palmicola]
MSLNKDPWAYARSPLESPPDDLHDVSLSDETHDSRSALSPGSRPECLRNLFHECLFVALIALAAATPVFLQRSIVVVTSSIAESLRMSPAELAWSTASSGLTTGAFLLPFGHIADTCAVLPRKALLVISLTAFALLTAGTSFSRNGIVLDILSGLTGIACAANVPIALGILSLVYPESSRRRNLVFSSFFMGTPAATIIGGLGSGGLALKMSWKAPFIALGGLFGVISILTWVFVPNIPDPEIVLQKSELRITTSRNAQQVVMLGAPKRLTMILQFDWAGLALLITGVILFTVSLTIGPEGPEPWKTPTVILLLTLGLLFLGCFIVWQNVSKRPMIPPSVWSNWSVTLVVICTLGASMAFYSQLFWVSMFMQQLENLNSFEVAVRLLPQALVGLLISPLVGLFMHAVPGTGLLAFAASALVLSNIFLVFLRHGSYYLLWIFPSIMLSTVGMDWVMNVGSLHILSSLPPEHHSIGASLLQATSRLGVPLGLAVTTSIWSSYDGKADWAQPELAYTHTFIATAAFSTLSLVLVPFIRIGKQGQVKRPSSVPEVEAPGNEKQSSLLSSTTSILHGTDSEKSTIRDVDRRPSKRWSPIGSVVPSSAGQRSTRAPSISSTSSMGMDTSKSDSIAKTAIRRGRCSSEKVVWIVCEECGTSKRQRESSSHTAMGDPTRYFNDIVHGLDSNISSRDAVHHPPFHHPQHHPQTSRRSPTKLGSPNRHDAAQRPFPGRRRLPLVNRQIMTHQILTQGFQP